MTAKILIATPQAEFGELVRLNIEEGGDYEATLVKTGREVMEMANASQYDLVILDAALSDKPFIPLAQNLLDENPNMRLIVLPPNNDPKDPSLEEIIYHGILSRPFYPPDLVDMVKELLTTPSHPFNGNGGSEGAHEEPAGIDLQEEVTDAQVQEAVPEEEKIAENQPASEPLNTVVPQTEPAHTASTAKDGPIINEEDFAKEVEALFAQEAAKKETSEPVNEIQSSPAPEIPVAETAPDVAESEPATLTEDETEAFARQLAAQIQQETSKSYMDAGLIEEATVLTDSDEILTDIPNEEPISNEQFARQIFSEVIQETGLSAAPMDQSFIDQLLKAENSEMPLSNEDQAPVPEITQTQESETLPNAQAEVETEVKVETEAVTEAEAKAEIEIENETEIESEVNMEVPVMAIEEPAPTPQPVESQTAAEDDEEALQDVLANETYDDLTQDDSVLAKKHSDMAARYAELASEYQSLAREHADLAQRHSEVATEKKRLEQERSELLTRKRELIGQIHQTGKSLSDIVSQTNANSAIILKGADLVAQHSQMSREALQEIATTISRHWDDNTKRDLVRFIRLSADNSEQSLYASLIREDFILGLIYDPATPISLMRSQSAVITNKLVKEPLIDYIKMPVEDLEKISEEEAFEDLIEENVNPLGLSEMTSDEENVLPDEWVPESTEIENLESISTPELPADDETSASDMLPEWLTNSHKNESEDLHPLLEDVLNQLQQQQIIHQETETAIEDDLIELEPPSTLQKKSDDWLEHANAQSILDDVLSQLQKQEFEESDIISREEEAQEIETPVILETELPFVSSESSENSEDILQSVLRQLQQQEEAVIEEEEAEDYELKDLDLTEFESLQTEFEASIPETVDADQAIILPASESYSEESPVEASPDVEEEPQTNNEQVIFLSAPESSPEQIITENLMEEAEVQGREVISSSADESTSEQITSMEDAPEEIEEIEIYDEQVSMPPAVDESDSEHPVTEEFVMETEEPETDNEQVIMLPAPETTSYQSSIEIPAEDKDTLEIEDSEVSEKYSEKVLQDVLSQLEKQEEAVEEQEFPPLDEEDDLLSDIDEMVEEIIPEILARNAVPSETFEVQKVTEPEESREEEKVIFQNVLDQLKQIEEPVSPTQSEETVTPLIFPWEENETSDQVIERTAPVYVSPREEDALSRTQPIKVNPPPAQITLHPEGLAKSAEEHKMVINNLLSQQTYTCVLIPRRTDTPLTTDFSHILGEQLTQIASVFGWNLEKIDITTDYLLWSIQVLPAVSAANMIRLIRQRTSRRLFTQYPYLLESNNSGDFWAPGFLTVSGTTPPDTNAIENFISQTRRRQQLINTLEA